MKLEKRSWADVPSDILSLILSRLIVVDSTTFRTVCRSWQSITIPAVRPSPFSESPYLMSLNGSLCKLYNPLYNATYHQNLPELSGMQIRSSNFGWLLVDRGSKIFFFNPFTKNRIDLPDIDIDNFIVSRFHFSSPPTSPDCTVIGFAGCLNNARLFIIKRGEPVWKFVVFDNYRRFIRSCRCAPVFSNGKFYFLGELGNIGVFDVEGGWWVILYVKYKNRHLVWPRSLMVEDNNGQSEALIAVFTSYEYRQVHIVRFDIPKRELEEVESFGSDEKMLYLSDGGSYLETSVARGMGNKIYFPHFHNDNGVFYSLDSKKYHSCDGSYASAIPTDLQEPRQCTWIKPLYTKADVEELKWCTRSTS